MPETPLLPGSLTAAMSFPLAAFHRNVSPFWSAAAMELPGGLNATSLTPLLLRSGSVAVRCPVTSHRYTLPLSSAAARTLSELNTTLSTPLVPGSRKGASGRDGGGPPRVSARRCVACGDADPPGDGDAAPDG